MGPARTAPVPVRSHPPPRPGLRPLHAWPQGRLATPRPAPARSTVLPGRCHDGRPHGPEHCLGHTTPDGREAQGPHRPWALRASPPPPRERLVGPRRPRAPPRQAGRLQGGCAPRAGPPCRRWAARRGGSGRCARAPGGCGRIVRLPGLRCAQRNRGARAPLPWRRFCACTGPPRHRRGGPAAVETRARTGPRPGGASPRLSPGGPLGRPPRTPPGHPPPDTRWSRRSAR